MARVQEIRALNKIVQLNPICGTVECFMCVEPHSIDDCSLARHTNTHKRFGMLNKTKSSNHQKWNKC